MGQISAPLPLMAGGSISQTPPQGLLNASSVVVLNQSPFTLQVTAPISSVVPAWWAMQVPGNGPGSPPIAAITNFSASVISATATGAQNGTVVLNWLGPGEEPPYVGSLNAGITPLATEAVTHMFISSLSTPATIVPAATYNQFIGLVTIANNGTGADLISIYLSTGGGPPVDLPVILASNTTIVLPLNLLLPAGAALEAVVSTATGTVAVYVGAAMGLMP